MASGILLQPAAKSAYDDMKERHMHKFVVFKFSDDRKSVELERVGDKNATFDDLQSQIPKNHVRYIFYDCSYETVRIGFR